MKNPWEWDVSDLESMVKADTQEGIELDFKASDSLQNNDKKKDEISKDVSAFANSAGGTLLYGMLENKSAHVAMGLDAGSDPAVITKEWLEQIINSRIQRRIDGIRINQIPLTKSPGRVPMLFMCLQVHEHRIRLLIKGFISDLTFIVFQWKSMKSVMLLVVGKYQIYKSSLNYQKLN